MTGFFRTTTVGVAKPAGDTAQRFRALDPNIVWRLSRVMRCECDRVLRDVSLLSGGGLVDVCSSFPSASPFLRSFLPVILG